MVYNHAYELYEKLYVTHPGNILSFKDVITSKQIVEYLLRILL